MSANAVIVLEEGGTDLQERMALDAMRIDAENLDVTSELGFKKITSIYADAKNLEKMIEQKRKEANAPYQSHINWHNDRAREILEPLKTIQGICKQKADKYQQLIERTKKDEEERIKQAAALFDEEMPYLTPVPTSIRGNGAVAYTKEETKFRLVDKSIVPLRYLMLDEAKIKQDIKLGLAEISGIEIYVEKTTQLKTRI